MITRQAKQSKAKQRVSTGNVSPDVSMLFSYLLLKLRVKCLSKVLPALDFVTGVCRALAKQALCGGSYWLYFCS